MDNQDLIIETIKEKFKFVNQELLKPKAVNKNHFIAIGIVVGSIFIGLGIAVGLVMGMGLN